METSQASVFAVPELLERILLDLSQFDIFVAQRVNRTFNSTIIGSPKLQRRLLATIPVENPNLEPYPKRSETRDARMNECFKLSFALARYFDHRPYDSFIFWHYDATESEPWIAALKFDVETNEDGPMGWKGKSAVHAKGSWRGISTGLAGGEYQLVAYLEGDESFDYTDLSETRAALPASPTFGDLFDFLEEHRTTLTEEQRVLDSLVEYDYAEGAEDSDYAEG